jgi:7,8-dihydropterin-6-yl-methyl-4-(beta-D-ribofuranosyl)aminobenzene 5'-phosphate synthase
MKVAVLIDNHPDPELKFLTEHGLSIYFEADGFKWLFDVGASGQFYANAINMGIHLEEVDFLVLSHGHSDHTGGLERFVAVNKKAKIFVSAQIEGTAFYSYRRQPKRNISIDHSVVNQNRDRFVRIADDMKISKNVGIVCNIPRIFEVPKANNKLYMARFNGDQPDEFKHEIALAVNTSAGTIVFLGCSHNGVLNMLHACSGYLKGSEIIACVGGTHLPDSDLENLYESDSEIIEIGRALVSHYPHMQLITGHCTGTHAQTILSEVMRDHFSVFYSGAMLSI